MIITLVISVLLVLYVVFVRGGEAGRKALEMKGKHRKGVGVGRASTKL